MALEPGKVFSVVLNDTARVAQCEYDLKAIVTAAAGPAGGPGTPGSGIALSELTTTIAVR